MGQLESYTIQDIFLVAILSGVLSTYFAEEIEATIESVVAYVYSANSYASKKRVKFMTKTTAAGTAGDALHSSSNFLRLADSSFSLIEKPIDSRSMWQDLFSTNWTASPAIVKNTYLEEHNKRGA